MTDQQNTAASEEETAPQFSLQRIYVRDLSFEAPKSPAIFRQQWEPSVGLDLNTRQKGTGRRLPRSRADPVRDREKR